MSKTIDGIDMVWPLWGWLTPDDRYANALAVFSGPVIHLAGYDPEAERWAEVARFTDVVVGEAGPLHAGFGTLESWLFDRYPKDELTRFSLNIE